MSSIPSVPSGPTTSSWVSEESQSLQCNQRLNAFLKQMPEFAEALTIPGVREAYGPILALLKSKLTSLSDQNIRQCAQEADAVFKEVIKGACFGNSIKIAKEIQERITHKMQEALKSLFSKKESVSLIKEVDATRVRAVWGENSDQGKIVARYWTCIGQTKDGYDSYARVQKCVSSVLGNLVPSLQMQGPFDCEKQDKAIVDGYLQTLDEFEKKIYGPFLRKEEAASEVQRLDTQYTLIQLQLFAPPLIKRLKRQRLERAICELETRMKAARWRMKVRLAFQRRSLASAQAKYAEIDQVLALSPDNPKELEKLIPEETECDQAIVSTVQNQVQEGIMMWKKKEEDLTEQYFLDKFEREAKTEIERFSKIASKNTLPPDSSAPL